MLTDEQKSLIDSKLVVIGSTVEVLQRRLAMFGHDADLKSIAGYLDARDDLKTGVSFGGSWPPVLFYEMKERPKQPTNKGNGKKVVEVMYARCHCHCPCSRRPLPGDKICQECMRGNHMGAG